MKFTAVKSLPIWLTIFSLIQGCTPRKFNTSTVKQAPSAESNSSVVQKNFGGAFNYGIKYSPVDEGVAKIFWESWKNSSSFGTRTANALKNVNPDTIGESLEIGEFTDQKTKNQVLELLKNWYAVAGKWMQASCQHIDMEEAFKGKFVPSLQILMNRGEKKCYIKGKNGQEISDQAGWDPTSRWFISNDRQPTASFMNDAGIGWQPDTGVAIAMNNGVRGGFVTRVNPEIEWKGSQGFSLVPAPHLVIGNYVIPAHTWNSSKAFSIPVMEFDGDPTSATYLKPKAWYDLGMLVLHGLPVSGNILVSRVSKSHSVVFENVAARKSVGFLGNQFAAERMNTFVTQAEALGKDYFRDEMMERMPIGSMHFIANAAWAQQGRGLTHYVYVKDVTREELIRMYIATDRSKGSVWINALDRINFGSNSLPNTDVTKALVGGECGLMTKNTGVTPNFFLETEIILGMEMGRQLLLSDRAAVSKCVEQDILD